MDLCREIDALDPQPEYRDEQRAWYDTLRDFAAVCRGTDVHATVRLYAGERVWCDLDPEDPQDRAWFRSKLESRRDGPRMRIHSDESPFVARVIPARPWSGDADEAREVLERVLDAWPSGTRTEYLLTPGGFLQFPFEEEVPSTDHVSESEALDRLMTKAEDVAHALLDGELENRLAEVTRYVSLGIDSFKDAVSTTGTRIPQPHVETVILVDLKTSTTWTTAKSYPTSDQQTGLLRNPNMDNHFLTLPDGTDVMLLGCHDLTAWNPRAIANAGGARAEWGKALRSRATEEEPELVLQHPHTADHPMTWKPAWGRLDRDLPSVSRYAAAGRYWHDDEGGPRSIFEKVRESTKKGDTLDFVLS